MAPSQGYTLIRHETAIDSTEARRQIIARCAILFVLILERLAFYALVASFFLFLNEGPWNEHDSWSSIEALNAVFVLLGMSYIFAPIGGYISDAWLGRFKSMILGFVLYITGYVLLTLMSVDALPHYICNLDNIGFLSELHSLPQAPCKSMVYISIVILAMGVGIVKSNIAPFGAEQLNTGNSKKIRAFFNWFYWCTNIGSLIGISAISFIEQDSPGFCTNGFFCGYVISTGCLCLALLVFICAYPWYHIISPDGSAIISIFKICWQGIKAQCRHWRYNRLNPSLSPLHVEPSCLDRAKIRYGGSFHEGTVDDVRALGKMMIVFMVFIPYWLVYVQMETTFQAQGLHMRFAGVYENFSSSEFIQPKWKFTIPAAWLTLFNELFLIISIPLLSTFLYPFLDRSGVRLSLFFRIGLGMVFSMFAVLTAGGLETYRIYLWRTDNSSHINQVIRNVTYHAVNISIFWQVPQYTLVGAAEAFTTIAGMEYAYSAAPSTFQGLIMGLFYSMNGIASFLGTGLLHLVAPVWFNKVTDFGNINDNHLDFYLYFLACIQVTALIIYVVVLYMRRFSLHLVTMPHPLAHQRRERDPPDGATTLPISVDEEQTIEEEDEQEEDLWEERTRESSALS